MKDFAFFFKIGWEHIISWDALDHLLFVFALTCIFLVKDWKKLLILVTAFTVGHSLTLILSAANIIRISTHLVEFLIPLTIFITALMNFLRKDATLNNVKLQYWLALGFGLIHGMGFANTIRMMLSKTQSILMPLFAFNVGLEVGQIVVVAAMIAVSYVLIDKIGLPRKWWIYGISAVAMVISINMCWDRIQ